MDQKVIYEYENYDIHLRRADRAKSNQNYALAYSEYVYAAKSLLLIAQLSSENLKEELKKKSNFLLKIAEECKEALEATLAAKEPPLERKPRERKKVKNEENTETIWEASEIPDISMDDVAGLEDVKQSVQMRVILPLQHPDVFERFKKKSGGGILLYGLPGTGKTMIAKAIAHEAGALFFSVKCSDIVAKWFGESEQNIKNLFEEVRKHERAIVFFDEFEALATKRGGESTVMNRVVPELLAQIQGFNDNPNQMLLLLAATNRPWAIDSAMLRPGRFNELIYVPLPDVEARLYILKKNLEEQGIPMAEDVSLEEIAERLEGYNGSDVVEFCERLKDFPIYRSINNESTNEVITSQDVEDTFAVVHSSVQQKDIKDLEKFRSQNDCE